MALNPTAFYNLNGNLVDSISANNGTGLSITYVSGLKNQCASFNGTTSNIIISDSNAFNFSSGDFFVSVWFKRGDVNRLQYVIGQNNNAGIDLSFIINIDASNKVNGSVFNAATTAKTIVSSTAITDTTTWHNVILTKDSTTLYLYLDGVLNGNISLTSFTINNSASQLGIGQTGAYALDRYNGLIDLVHIEKQSGLTYISQIYNGGYGLAYPFNNSKFFIIL